MYLLIGDIHLKCLNIIEDSQFLCSCAYAIELCIQNHKSINDITHIVFMGDIFHYHNILYVDSLNLFSNFIEKILSINDTLKIVIIVGNHDMTNQKNKNSSHAFQPFKLIERILIIDDWIVDSNFLYIPYVDNIHRKTFNDDLEIILKNNKNIKAIFSHIQTEGVIYENNTTSETGLIWKQEYPLLISGHIHKSQKCRNNIFYTGNCRYTNNHNNIHTLEDKGIWLLDIETLDLKLLPIESKIKLNLSIQFEDLEELLNKLKNRIYSDNINITLLIKNIEEKKQILQNELYLRYKSLISFHFNFNKNDNIDNILNEISGNYTEKLFEVIKIYPEYELLKEYLNKLIVI